MLDQVLEQVDVMCNVPPGYKGTLCWTDDASKNLLHFKANKFGNTFINDMASRDRPVSPGPEGQGTLGTRVMDSRNNIRTHHRPSSFV